MNKPFRQELSKVTDESLRDVDFEPHPVSHLQPTVSPLHAAADRLHAGLNGELTSPPSPSSASPLLNCAHQTGTAAGQSAHTGGPHSSSHSSPRSPREDGPGRARILRDLQTPHCGRVSNPGPGVDGAHRLSPRD